MRPSSILGLTGVGTGRRHPHSSSKSPATFNAAKRDPQPISREVPLRRSHLFHGDRPPDDDSSSESEDDSSNDEEPPSLLLPRNGSDSETELVDYDDDSEDEAIPLPPPRPQRPPRPQKKPSSKRVRFNNLPPSSSREDTLRRRRTSRISGSSSTKPITPRKRQAPVEETVKKSKPAAHVPSEAQVSRAETTAGKYDSIDDNSTPGSPAQSHPGKLSPLQFRRAVT